MDVETLKNSFGVSFHSSGLNTIALKLTLKKKKREKKTTFLPHSHLYTSNQAEASGWCCKLSQQSFYSYQA